MHVGADLTPASIRASGLNIRKTVMSVSDNLGDFVPRLIIDAQPQVDDVAILPALERPRFRFLLNPLDPDRPTRTA